MKNVLFAKINYALFGVIKSDKRNYYKSKIYGTKELSKIEAILDNLIKHNEENYAGEEVETLCPDCNSKLFARNDGKTFCKTMGCYYIGN